MHVDRPFTVNDWTVEPDRNRLVRGDERKAVRPQVMNLLVYLAERPGTVAHTDELMRELWPKRIVTDATLYNCVAELRQALGEGQGGRRFVQTVHKKGYRLCAEVSPSGSREDETAESSNLEASKAMQLGDQRMDRRNLEGWKQAEKYYRRAIELDPDSSAGWQKLAESIVVQFGTFSKPVEQLREASAAAGRALELDDQNGLAWITCARANEALAVAEHRRIPRQKLHEHCQRAIDLVPDNADATREYGLLLLRTKGQASKAIDLLEHSVERDPLSGVSHFALGRAYRSAGRSGDALMSLQRSLELQPDNPYPIWETGLTYYAMGELADALVWGARALEFERDDPSGPFLLAQVALNLGDLELAEAWITRGLKDAPDVPIAAATQMSLALFRDDLPQAWLLADDVVPHAGEMRIVHPGAVAQALWILRDRDIQSGQPQHALNRYARYVPELFEDNVSGEDLWLVAAVDVAYLLRQTGEYERADALLERTRQEAGSRQSGNVREPDPQWIEIEATALLGDLSGAEELLRLRAGAGWIRWWQMLRMRPTIEPLLDTTSWREADREIQQQRTRERERYLEMSSQL